MFFKQGGREMISQPQPDKFCSSEVCTNFEICFFNIISNGNNFIFIKHSFTSYFEICLYNPCFYNFK